MNSAEAAILERVIAPEDLSLSRPAAEAVLKLSFASADLSRMDELAEKARAGLLSPAEKEEADAYERIGFFISILQLKARRTLAAPAAYGSSCT